jgi:four helix bundle protein
LGEAAPNQEVKMAFQVLEVAQSMVRQLGPVVRSIARADGSLADQLRRAATSVPLNISEGNGRAGRDRAHHFRVAAGSTREVRAALEVALAWGYVEAGAVEGPLGEADRVIAMLWRLAR